MRSLVGLTLSVLVCLVMGCAPRFETLASGDYLCSAVLTTNGCDETLPSPTTFTTPLTGGGSYAITIELPSSQSRFAGEVILESAQFGVQGDPNRYLYTTDTTCRPETSLAEAVLVTTEVDVRLTSYGEDALEIVVAHRFPDYDGCTATPSMSAACEMIWEIDCARTP